jgi:phosphopantothenoylcysteine decarboxylase/phosphopantothenate--cysteine ligase
LLTAAALAAPCPVAVAPAMNDKMYIHPATQANLEVLRARGVAVIAPGEGELASHGEHGIGRLPDPAELLAASEALIGARGGSWAGVRVLVTAGGTREPIDSVRYVGNRSSGRMGFAMASQAASRGAAVTLVAANTSLAAPPGARVIEVGTAAELAAACEPEFDSCDVLLMAAAVADFRPTTPAHDKLKKEAGAPAPIELELTDDVLSALSGRRRRDQVLVGFAAEHGDGALSRGLEKLERKRLDAVVVNDISQPGVGFDSDENEVTIIAVDGARLSVPRAGKDLIAGAVLDEVERLRAGRSRDERRGDSDGAARAGTRSTARV